MNGFSWNFQDMLTMTQGTIWNILGVMCSTPWVQDSFFYFQDPCLSATLWNNRWIGIHEILRIWTHGAIGWTVSHLSRLFHAPQTRHGGGLRFQSASCLVHVIHWPDIFYGFNPMVLRKLYDCPRAIFSGQFSQSRFHLNCNFSPIWGWALAWYPNWI